MKKWGFAVISIGCLFIASAPLTNQQLSMIGSGLLIVIIGVMLVVKKERNEIKSNGKIKK